MKNSLKIFKIYDKNFLLITKAQKSLRYYEIKRYIYNN